MWSVNDAYLRARFSNLDVSDERGVSVTGDGQGVSVTGDGNRTFVGGQHRTFVGGRGQGVSVNGQGVSVRGDGNRVSVDGQGVSVNGQRVAGDGNRVFVTGDGNRVSVNGQGVAGDGNRVFVIGNGNRVSVNGQGVAGDGQRVAVTGNGNRVSVNGQGVSVNGQIVAGDGQGVSVTGDGNRVSVDGQRVAVNGQGVSVNGQGVSVNGDGHRVSVDGQVVSVNGDGHRVSVDGQGVSVNGQIVAGDANRVFVNEQEVPANGQEVPANGQEVPANGQGVSANGQEVSVDGQGVSANGQEVSVDGQGVSVDGQRVAGDANRVFVNKQEVPANGQVFSVNGQRISFDGQVVSVNGQVFSINGYGNRVFIGISVILNTVEDYRKSCQICLVENIGFPTLCNQGDSVEHTFCLECVLKVCLQKGSLSAPCPSCRSPFNINDFLISRELHLIQSAPMDFAINYIEHMATNDSQWAMETDAPSVQERIANHISLAQYFVLANKEDQQEIISKIYWGNNALFNESTESQPINESTELQPNSKPNSIRIKQNLLDIIGNPWSPELSKQKSHEMLLNIFTNGWLVRPLYKETQETFLHRCHLFIRKVLPLKDIIDGRVSRLHDRVYRYGVFISEYRSKDIERSFVDLDNKVYTRWGSRVANRTYTGPLKEEDNSYPVLYEKRIDWNILERIKQVQDRLTITK